MGATLHSVKIPGLTAIAVVVALGVAAYVTVIAPPTTPNAAESLAATQACVDTSPVLHVNQTLTQEFSGGVGSNSLLGLTYFAANVVVLFFDSDAQANTAQASLTTSLLGTNRSAPATAKLKAELAQQLVRRGGALMFWSKRSPSSAERQGVGTCIYTVRDPGWKSLAFLHGKTTTRPFLNG